jgi:hypothetical protein
MRQKKDCISLWNKNCSDHETTERIRDSLRKVLNLPAHIQMEYRYHKDFLTWVNQRDGKEGGGPSSSFAGGDAPAILARTPTTPVDRGALGFPGGKPRSGSPPHFGEIGRGALPQINLSSNSSSHR